MRTSQRGRAFIGRHEGLRLVAYRDPVGVWTIGYGHTSAAGPPEVRPGLRVTRDEAEAILTRDLIRFEQGVETALPPGLALAQHEFDALVSLAFNIGVGAFRRSTVIRRLAAGDRRGAADSFLLWNKGGGRILRGLTLRREAERRLFLTGDYANRANRAALLRIAAAILAAVRAALRRAPD